MDTTEVVEGNMDAMALTMKDLNAKRAMSQWMVSIVFEKNASSKSDQDEETSTVRHVATRFYMRTAGEEPSSLCFAPVLTCRSVLRRPKGADASAPTLSRFYLPEFIKNFEALPLKILMHWLMVQDEAPFDVTSFEMKVDAVHDKQERLFYQWRIWSLDEIVSAISKIQILSHSCMPMGSSKDKNPMTSLRRGVRSLLYYMKIPVWRCILMMEKNINIDIANLEAQGVADGTSAGMLGRPHHELLQHIDRIAAQASGAVTANQFLCFNVACDNDGNRDPQQAAALNSVVQGAEMILSDGLPYVVQKDCVVFEPFIGNLAPKTSASSDDTSSSSATSSMSSIVAKKPRKPRVSKKTLIENTENVVGEDGIAVPKKARKPRKPKNKSLQDQPMEGFMPQDEVLEFNTECFEEDVATFSQHAPEMHYADNGNYDSELLPISDQVQNAAVLDTARQSESHSIPLPIVSADKVVQQELLPFSQTRSPSDDVMTSDGGATVEISNSQQSASRKLASSTSTTSTEVYQNVEAMSLFDSQEIWPPQFGLDDDAHYNFTSASFGAMPGVGGNKFDDIDWTSLIDEAEKTILIHAPKATVNITVNYRPLVVNNVVVHNAADIVTEAKQDCPTEKDEPEIPKPSTRVKRRRIFPTAEMIVGSHIPSRMRGYHFSAK